jgi:hypothetical protein
VQVREAPEVRVVLVALEELAAPVGLPDHRGVREAVLKDLADPPASMRLERCPNHSAARHHDVDDHVAKSEAAM